MNTQRNAELKVNRNVRTLIRQNVQIARRNWGISTNQIASLRTLTQTFLLSLSAGDLSLLNGSWYVTHAGLLRIAMRRRCQGIRTALQERHSDAHTGRWVFKAIAYKTRTSKGFVGYGDADPSNVSPLVRGTEMRIAETRAVNRALRKAYGIGLCSVEELGWSPRTSEPAQQNQPKTFNGNGVGHSNGRPRLRDQLCLLIRQYGLDPNLVKAYAAHFCGTETIKDASRDLVESFVAHLAASAKEDREGLICKLNSFSRVQEVRQ